MDDDELRFDFRDPDHSDGDDTEDDADTDAAAAAFGIEEGEDEEFQLRDQHDSTSICANTRNPGEPHIVGETSESKYTFPYVQALELGRSLQAGISLLEQSPVPQGPEDKSSGPGPTTSNSGDPDSFLDLKNDLQKVLSRFTEVKEALEGFRGDADAAVIERLADTCKTSENLGEGSRELPIRRRIIMTWNQRGGIPAASHEHYSVAEPSDETLKEHLLRVGPALRSLMKVTEDLASGSARLQMMIDSAEEGENTDESGIKAAYGGPEATRTNLRPETPDGRSEASARGIFGKEDGEEISSPTQQYTEAGPSHGIRRSEKGDFPRVLSRRQRLEARLWNSRINGGSYVCSRCGVQQNIRVKDDICKICSDLNRSFYLLNPGWLSHMEVENMSLENSFRLLEPDLFYQIYTIPRCFQSHRAIFLKLSGTVSPSSIIDSVKDSFLPFSQGVQQHLAIYEGNILWNCLTYIDEQTVAEIAQMGGLTAIAISSPDRIGSCARLSYIFNRDYLAGVPGKSAREIWYTKTKYLGDGVTLIHLGGHFLESCIFHLDRKGGIIFSSNTLKVGADRKSVSVMLDYSNYIPASPKDVKRILRIMEDLDFDQVWGDQPGEEILEEAKPTVISSLKRYIQWTQHDEDAMEVQTVPLTKRELIARGKRKVDEI